MSIAARTRLSGMALALGFAWAQACAPATGQNAATASPPPGSQRHGGER